MKQYLVILILLLAVVLAGCAPAATPLPDEHEPPAPPFDLTATPAAVQQGEPTATQPAVATPTPLSQAGPSVEQPSATPTTQAAAPGPLPGVVSFPDMSSYQWQMVATGLEYPLGIEHPDDGSNRLFILGQTGLIYVLEGSQVLPEPFLDLRSKVSGPTPGSYTERGLLGLAFHPRYAENGYFYVNYTDRQGNTVIARYQVSADPDRADVDSEVRLLGVQQPYANHNGGGMVFGPDGNLYIGLGDGGSAGDPEGRAQSLDTHLGKLLRIDVDHGDPYAIPADNPFAAGGGLPEIWAYGLRNPWRFSFDSQTSDLYIGDVGQNSWEEVDYLPAGSPGGANFGWDYREGLHAYEGTPPDSASLIDPVAEYSHAEGCSITGGVVVRDPLLPGLQGVYLYGDYCSGKVWGLLRDESGAWQSQVLFETQARVVSFGQDADKGVYFADLQGSVYHLVKK